MSYQIVSKRLVIRQFNPEDITEKYLGWLNDKELMRHSRQRFLTHTPGSCRAYLSGFSPPNGLWNVLTHEGEQVGTLTTYVDLFRAKVGILIGCGGRGYGREAFGAALTCLFEVYSRVEEVATGTAKGNVPMQRIAAGWGMRPIPAKKEEDLLYTLTRAEWQARGQTGYTILRASAPTPPSS